MRIHGFLAPTLVVVATLASGKPSPSDGFTDTVRPFIEQYCLECHRGAKAAGDLPLHRYRNAADALEDPDEWRLVHDKIALRHMPPGGQPQPSRAQRRAVLDWIDQAFALGGSVSDPGSAVIRRLNHREYRNTVRALLGIEAPSVHDWPTENVGHGFDNQGASLTLSDGMVARYLEAAEDIARRAVVLPTEGSVLHRFGAEELEGRHGRGAVFLTTRGAASRRWQCLQSGRFRIGVEAWGQQAGPDPCRMDVQLDGNSLGLVEVPQGREAPGHFTFETQVDLGAHRLEAWFVNDYYRPEHPDPAQRDRNLAVTAITIEGPLDPSPPSAWQQGLAERHPATLGQNRLSSAIQEVASLFWRRPARDDEVARLLRLVGPDLSFDRGLRKVLVALLVSPRFLFRIEEDPISAPPIRDLDSWELATRLSYFLWSRPPDAELRRLAAADALSEEAVLDAQVVRMLADPRSRSLAEDFGGQWLQLPMLEELHFDARTLPAWSTPLRRSMREETIRFVDDQVRRNRPLNELLTAEDSFVDARLARHYGIPGVEGDSFRRVSVAPGNRRGLLGQASVLTLTSNPTRTSPVKRGRWVLETLLGTPPPPPPPNAGQFVEAQVRDASSMRARLAEHRARSECAVCHDLMDPLGLGLESYDPLGQIRSQEVDASGTLPGGRAFAGPMELAEILAEDPAFTETVAEKLYVYALGRGLEPNDFRILDSILSHSADTPLRWQTLIRRVIRSDAFRRKKSTRPSHP